MDRTIKIGARRSDLARLQAYRVGSVLQELGGVKVEYLFKESLGDKNLNDPLWKMPEKGVFTQDFVADLIAAKVDLVVHSWKDLPTERPAGLKILGTLRREDSRDLLLIKKSRLETVYTTGILRIFSSSPRRAHHLKPFLKWALPRELSEVECLPVRGNIRTRIEKMLSSDVDGIVIAKAAVDRLLSAPEKEFLDSQASLRMALSLCRFMVLPLEADPCAAAQGALAIEAREDREDLASLIALVNCEQSFESVALERETLARYGGGCHQKIGVSCLPLRGGFLLRAKGELADGTVIDSKQFFSTDNKIQTSFDTDEIFPKTLEDMAWFSRDALKLKKTSALSGLNAFFISKSQALSVDLMEEINSAEAIWVAGLTSWRKLARLGLWVCGCSESLGEYNLPPRIDWLMAPSTRWWKLTHEHAKNDGQSMPTLSSYKMTPLADKVPDLRSYKVFFWPSFSHFSLAFKLYPEHLAGAQHFSGPGSSFDLISKALGSKPKLALSFEDFQHQMTRSKS